ncbi:MAG: VPGUxxT family thioredoxin-like (seleno)protein, type 2 [Verrucomicrobiota bacterium]
MKAPLLGSLFALFASLHHLSAANPVEVGDVEWTRDFEAALKTSAATKKPVFALFQEVPGCAGCQKFGREVLTNQLLVEAIESQFVPVLIYNNQGGNDAKLLRRFNEPSWNYQVVRFFDSEAKDIIPRRDRIWTLAALATRMVETLETANREVPNYLRTLAEGQNNASHQKAAFSMFCFWTGELHLGQIEGVVQTEAGWFDGHEVTLVTYDPGQLSFPDLVQAAEEAKCANSVYTSSDAQRKELGKTRLKTGTLDGSYRAARASDQKRQILGTSWTNLDLNPMQETKVNAWARVDVDEALSWLSPRQIKQLKGG